MLESKDMEPLKRIIDDNYCPDEKKKNSYPLDEQKIAKLIMLTENERSKHFWIEDGVNNTFKDNDWSKVIKYLYDLELQPQYRICKYFYYSPISNSFVGVDWQDNVIRGYLTICRNQFGKRVKKEYLSSKRFVCLINGNYLLDENSTNQQNITYHKQQKMVLLALKEFYSKYNFIAKIAKIPKKC